MMRLPPSKTRQDKVNTTAPVKISSRAASKPRPEPRQNPVPEGLAFFCDDCGWEIAAHAASGNEGAQLEYALVRDCKECGFRMRLHMRQRTLDEIRVCAAAAGRGGRF
jgi:hypothetical protein